MARLFPQTLQALDSNGDPASGARLSVYQAGTLTPVDTFSDAGLTTLQTKPIVADSGGYFDAIYVAGGRKYRYILNTSGGTTLDDQDDIVANEDSDAQLGLVFDTISDAIAYTGFGVNDTFRTLGYNTIGDGGGNDYLVVAAATGTDDGGTYIDLTGSSLQAQGLFPDRVYLANKFGAIADGTTNDRAAIVAADAAARATASTDDGVNTNEARLLLDGRYRLNSALTLTSRRASLRGAILGGYHVEWASVSNLRVELDLYTDVENTAGIRINDECDDVVMTGWLRYAGWGLQFKPGVAGASKFATDIMLHDMTFEGVGTDNKSAVLFDAGARRILLRDMTFQNIARSSSPSAAAGISISSAFGRADVNALEQTDQVDIDGVIGRDCEFGSLVRCEDNIKNLRIANVSAGGNVAAAVYVVNTAFIRGAIIEKVSKFGSGSAVEITGTGFSDDITIRGIRYDLDGDTNTDYVISVINASSRNVKLDDIVLIGHGDDPIRMRAGSGRVSNLTALDVTGNVLYGNSALPTAGEVTDLVVVENGLGYDLPPEVTITGDGSGAEVLVHIDSNGQIDSTFIKSAGSGYTSITLSVTGTGTLSGTLNSGALDSVSITDAGDPAEYSASPTLAISGGGGSGATAVPYVNQLGRIDSVDLTAAGSGYTSAPSVAASGGGSPSKTPLFRAAIANEDRVVIESNCRFVNVGGIIDTSNAANFMGDQYRDSQELDAQTSGTSLVFRAERPGFITHVGRVITSSTSATVNGSVTLQAYNSSGTTNIQSMNIPYTSSKWDEKVWGFGEASALTAHQFERGDLLILSDTGNADAELLYKIWVRFFYYEDV